MVNIKKFKTIQKFKSINGYHTYKDFTVPQGSELFVNLSSQQAQKTANLDLSVNLILQIEFAQFIK